MERIRGLIIIGLLGKSMYPHAPIKCHEGRTEKKRREKETRKNNTGRPSFEQGA